MKYRAEAAYHQPVHFLRFLMGLEEGGLLSKEQAGVLDRTWEVEQLYSAVYVAQQDGSMVEIEIFPGLETQKPLLVDGMQLLQRLALVTDFEESVFKRLASGGTKGYDLVLVADTGPPALVVETDDEALFEKIKDHFQKTSSEEFRQCFW